MPEITTETVKRILADMRQADNYKQQIPLRAYELVDQSDPAKIPLLIDNLLENAILTVLKKRGNPDEMEYDMITAVADELNYRARQRNILRSSGTPKQPVIADEWRNSFTESEQRRVEQIIKRFEQDGKLDQLYESTFGMPQSRMYESAKIYAENQLCNALGHILCRQSRNLLGQSLENVTHILSQTLNNSHITWSYYCPRDPAFPEFEQKRDQIEEVLTYLQSHHQMGLLRETAKPICPDNRSIDGLIAESIYNHLTTRTLTADEFLFMAENPSYMQNELLLTLKDNITELSLKRSSSTNSGPSR